MDWAEMSVAYLADQLQRGLIDARALTEYFIGRITAYKDDSVFTAFTFDRARSEAAESAARLESGDARGFLDGVPVTWKDVFDVSGTVTTAGSAVRRNASRAISDAVTVQNLANAGMVCLGKTNLSEFAYSALGLNPHFGTPSNPTSAKSTRVPGGSSSGAAVSVAAGLCPVAIGTDTGGSVRTPAAFNGIVGYKSSEGRICTSGVFPLSKTLDTVGVLARSVLDCYLVDQALRGLPVKLPDPVFDEGLSSLRFVVPTNDVFDDIQRDVRRNFDRGMRDLERRGAIIERRNFPEITQLRLLGAEHGSIAAAEGYWLHRQLLDSAQAAMIDPNVRLRLQIGQSMSAYNLVALQQGRLEAARSLWETIGAGFLVMPTVPHIAPLMQSIVDDPEYFASVNLRTLRNAGLVNLLNGCCIAIPDGTGADRMPTSLSIASVNGNEECLFQAALKVTSTMRP